MPLQHYLRECPATEPLRVGLGRRLSLEVDTDAASSRTSAPFHLLLDIIQRYPPPD